MILFGKLVLLDPHLKKNKRNLSMQLVDAELFHKEKFENQQKQEIAKANLEVEEAERLLSEKKKKNSSWWKFFLNLHKSFFLFIYLIIYLFVLYICIYCVISFNYLPQNPLSLDNDSSIDALIVFPLVFPFF